MKNKTHQWVTKGFGKLYALKDPLQINALVRFLSDFSEDFPSLNQDLVHPLEMEYQNLNLIETHPELIHSSIIYTRPLRFLTENALENCKIITGHTLVKKDGIYISDYIKPVGGNKNLK